MRSGLLPLKKPQPDARRFIEVVAGKVVPLRLPLIDLKASQAVMKPVVTGLLGRNWVDYELLSFPALSNALMGQKIEPKAEKIAWDNFIAFWYYLGYDVLRMELGMYFPRRAPSSIDNTMMSGRRDWADLSTGVIVDWASYELYPWPKVEDVDFSPLEYLSANLPDGMGIMVSHAAGVFEHLSELLSFQKLCYLIYDDPQLVKATCDRIGKLMEDFYRQVVDFPRVVALFPGDDMGFRSGTLISHQHLRDLILPWHTCYSQIAHDKGLCYFLHSCGNVYGLMPDLIDSVKVDAKHSFEDAVLPVEQFLATYGNHVAALGGLDVNFISQSSPENIRDYVNNKINTCAPFGRFAIGTGSSITSYIPSENYLAIVETVLSY
jgi:uroporphyrinogen decarboxylase